MVFYMCRCSAFLYKIHNVHQARAWCVLLHAHNPASALLLRSACTVSCAVSHDDESMTSSRVEGAALDLQRLTA